MKKLTKLEKMEVIFWTLIMYAKMRLVWVLYNLIYIHILRKKHPNETFEYVSFDDWCKLALDDVRQQLGLERERD